MRAMVLKQTGKPLELQDLTVPTPSSKEILVKVLTCGVCRTDLHIVEGDLKELKLPLILGHQVVGVVESIGEGSSRFQKGDRVGIPWLGKTCHSCEFCLSNRENLCDKALFTGYQLQGGYAEYLTVLEEYAFPLSSKYPDEKMAPLLCAGLIGYRAFCLTGKPKKIGFYGLGSSAHLLTQLTTQMGHEIYIFVRPGDKEKIQFAKKLGAKWAGFSDQKSPDLLDAAILFAPVGDLYIEALKNVKKGGKVISAGIHMSDIPSFSYPLLWEERVMTSVANLTRKDGEEFLQLIDQYPLKVETTVFPLEKANEALQMIKEGKVDGSVVLKI